MPGNNDEWAVWSKHVLMELDRLADCFERLDAKQTSCRDDMRKLFHETIRKLEVDLKTEIAALKVRSGVWGAIAGAIPALVAIVFFIAKK